MIFQLIIVIVVLVGAAGYGAWRLYRLLSGKNEVCEGCPLADSCTKKNNIENCGSGYHKC